MASDQAVAVAVVAAFTAACAQAGESEHHLYRRVLHTVDDDELREAVRHIVLTEHWEYGRKPSPAMFMDAVRHVRQSRAARAGPAALTEGDVTPAEQLRNRVAALRTAHHFPARSTP